MQVYDKNEPMSGIFISRSFDSIAAKLVKEGDIVLHDNEEITGVRVEAFGLSFAIEKKSQTTS